MAHRIQVNLVSFLVSLISPSYHVPPNSLTVQFICLHTLCVTHVISCQRVQHELGGVAVFVAANWVTWGRQSFVGPVQTFT